MSIPIVVGGVGGGGAAAPWNSATPWVPPGWMEGKPGDQPPPGWGTAAAFDQSTIGQPIDNLPGQFVQRNQFTPPPGSGPLFFPPDNGFRGGVGSSQAATGGRETMHDPSTYTSILTAGGNPGFVATGNPLYPPNGAAPIAPIPAAPPAPTTYSYGVPQPTASTAAYNPAPVPAPPPTNPLHAAIQSQVMAPAAAPAIQQGLAPGDTRKRTPGAAAGTYGY